MHNIIEQYGTFSEIFLNKHSTIVDCGVGNNIFNGWRETKVNNTIHAKVDRELAEEAIVKYIGRSANGRVAIHVNGCVLDNRGNNITLCSKREAQQHRRLLKPRNLVGIKFDSISKKYAASVVNNGKKSILGYYKTKYDALIAREKLLVEGDKQSNLIGWGITKPVIAFAGQQGSGKDTWMNHLIEMFSRLNVDTKTTGIKKTFRHHAESVTQELDSLGYNVSELAHKELLLRISTWAEEHVDENIWSDLFLDQLLDVRTVAIASDIRTQMNVDALEKAGKIRKVVLINLTASEEARKKRIKGHWRKNGGYTEKKLHRGMLKENAVDWYDINTETDIKEIFPQIVEAVFKRF
jgi:dephospho-CoA kinase